MSDDQMRIGSTDRLERKIDALADSVGEVKQELGEVKSELGNVKSELGNVKSELQALGKQVTQVHVLAEKTEQFTKDAWDSLESLRKDVTNGFEESKKDREEGFQIVHLAIQRLGEKVQRIEEAPARARNREL